MGTVKYNPHYMGSVSVIPLYLLCWDCQVLYFSEIKTVNGLWTNNNKNWTNNAFSLYIYNLFRIKRLHCFLLYLSSQLCAEIGQDFFLTEELRITVK